MENKELRLVDNEPFQFPTYPDRDTSRANRYVSETGLTFWFDAVTECVVTADPDLFLQVICRADLGDIQDLLILNIAGRKIQITTQRLREHSGVPGTDPKFHWIIEDIGRPLVYYTGWDDARQGIKRPQHQRYQMLTNSDRFATAAQQDLALAFVLAALGRYGNLYSSGPAGGFDIPATIALSDDLKEKIAAGKLISG